MGWYAAATVNVGDHLQLPNTHAFEYSEVMERVERVEGKLEFRTQVLPIEEPYKKSVRPEGTLDQLVVGSEERVQATLTRDVRSQQYDVHVIDTHTRIIRVMAPDKVAAEEAAYWRLSSDREQSDAKLISEDSNRRYEVSG